MTCVLKWIDLFVIYIDETDSYPSIELNKDLFARALSPHLKELAVYIESTEDGQRVYTNQSGS